MKFSVAAALAIVLPLVAASPAQKAPTAIRQQQPLADWWREVPFTIFPNHTGWDASYDAVFDPNLKATFNFAPHNFTSLKRFFSGVYSVASTKYDYLAITPLDSVVVPSTTGGLGGVVYMTGREAGKLKGNSTVRVERDAVFAVVSEVNGQRKFTEWRESTNFF
ncbi:hypothetical protein B0O99DRAFT_281514 [Bisporella sp. PMI_857]|nr:hypothetical protein B0O99DRAFT_281514 [Bisporella sp. PMI_857]